MSRRRQLSDEDHALWTGVTHSVTPLPRSKTIAKPTAAGGEASPAPPAAGSKAKSAPPRLTPRQDKPAPTKVPPLSPFERRLKQRVARGRAPIDDRIDLHGMTQFQAHAALLHFLRRAQAASARIVLIVTGKGSGRGERDGAIERGVLKRQVPLWLSLPEFRPFVVGFEDAHVSHGGQGALYVRLRRVR
jgi:DNA-nicking Smr family endonuclease